MDTDRMIKWFEYDKELPEAQQHMSERFLKLAINICLYIPAGPERTVALRKLLEAKDAVTRAALHPGG